MLVKETVRRKGMRRRQGNDKRLYVTRQEGGQGLISLRQVYKKAKVGVAPYMVLSPSCWIRVAWERGYNSKHKSFKREAEQALREIGLEVDYREEEIWKNGEKVEKDWSGCWKELKYEMKRGYEEKLKNECKEKVMQS